jgi:hypothetical protein
MDAQGDLPPAQPLQSNLPEALAGRQYFRPGKQGAEARLRAWLDQRRGPVHDEPDPFADEDA